MRSFCSKCGKEIQAVGKFCPFCGTIQLSRMRSASMSVSHNRDGRQSQDSMSSFGSYQHSDNRNRRIDIIACVVFVILMASIAGAGVGKSQLIGRWIAEDNRQQTLTDYFYNSYYMTFEFPATIEMFSDRTGMYGKAGMSYRATNGRLKVSGFYGCAGIYDYKIRGSKLILTNSAGSVHIRDSREAIFFLT